jgi:hypothetical protein
MKYIAPVAAATALGFLILIPAPVAAHDPITTKVTWTREMSRLLFKRCTSCHREGGSSFPLSTYEEARPWAKAIKEETQSRRMPPFAAAKGFGEVRDEEALTIEQIQLIADWVEGGAPEGDPGLLPEKPEVNPPPLPAPKTSGEVPIDTAKPLVKAVSAIGIRAKDLTDGASVRLIAVRPDGTFAPLVWVYEYRKQFDHPWYFRNPVSLPANTKIVASPAGKGSFILLESAGGRSSTSTAP